jgi:hypothetical protein
MIAEVPDLWDVNIRRWERERAFPDTGRDLPFRLAQLLRARAGVAGR